MGSIRAFIIDYCQRHAHPVNAILHIFGVPAVFYGLFLLFAAQPALGLGLIVLGYIFQYLGHKAQGNEVGEVTLIKHVWRRLHAKEEA
ncbi:MAG TPA: Mpo1-like protein [Trichormus sp.]